MPIQTPGKRPAPRFEHSMAVGGKFGHGRKGTNADLQLTSMVDMFTLLVIFLLANFSATGEAFYQTKDIALPTASHGTDLERVPVVAISDRFIGLEGTEVVAVDRVSGEQLLNIQQLEDALRDMKKHAELVHQLDVDYRFDGKVNIQADKHLPFKLLKRVMYSCAMAGFGNINFAVLAGRQDRLKPTGP